MLTLMKAIIYLNQTSTTSPKLKVRNKKKIKQQQQQPIACADTGSDRILLLQDDISAAALDIQSTAHPLQGRFPDDETAVVSIGTADDVA